MHMENARIPDRWARTWRNLGARGIPTDALAALVEAYTGPDRHYHNLGHVLDCLDKLDCLEGPSLHRAEVELALWFHDVIYDARASDNEFRSAELARSVMQSQNVPELGAERVVRLILATAHSAEPETEEEQLICDIDLSILGETPERFRLYDEQIRLEYAWVVDAVYRQKRSQVVESFLRRPHIYRTEFFFGRFEVSARINLHRLLVDLR